MTTTEEKTGHFVSFFTFKNLRNFSDSLIVSQCKLFWIFVWNEFQYDQKELEQVCLVVILILNWFLSIIYHLRILQNSTSRKKLLEELFTLLKFNAFLRRRNYLFQLWACEQIWILNNMIEKSDLYFIVFNMCVFIHEVKNFLTDIEEILRFQEF